MSLKKETSSSLGSCPLSQLPSLSQKISQPLKCLKQNPEGGRERVILDLSPSPTSPCTSLLARLTDSTSECFYPVNLLLPILPNPPSPGHHLAGMSMQGFQSCCLLYCYSHPPPTQAPHGSYKGLKKKKSHVTTLLFRRLEPFLDKSFHQRIRLSSSQRNVSHDKKTNGR